MHSQDYETLKYEQKIYAILEKLRTEANLKIKLLTCLGANDQTQRFVGFAPEGGGKSGSLIFLSSQYKIPLELCLTFGDSLNDADMLEVSKGGSVLVSNSQPEFLEWYEVKKSTSPWLEISKYNHANAITVKLNEILNRMD